MQLTDYMEQILALGLLAEKGWSAEQQIACLYSCSNAPEAHYYPLTIAKQNGGHRKLLVPDPLLKGIQQAILRNVLERQPVSPYAMAYHKGAAIRKNAIVHQGKPMVLKLDIADFFSSVLISDVLSACFSSGNFLPQTGMLLAGLCCYRGYLPQGAPTSPAISNLVMASFDAWLGDWCKEQQITYTRYSDDLIFSGDFDAGLVRRRVEGALQARGFLLNHKKTRLLRAGQQQLVTGVVVNEKLQVPRSYRRAVRQALYYCQRYGVRSHLAHQLQLPEDIIEDGQVKAYLHTLLGKINFILQIQPQDCEWLQGRQQVKQWLME